MNRTRVKICGITRLEDALVAVDAGADAIGLVLWNGSKRAVTIASARAIADRMPASVSVVGVFVDADINQVRDAADSTGINVAQLCGSTGTDDWSGLPRTLRIIRSLTISAANVPDKSLHMQGVGDYLIDNGSGGQHGGTGLPFDWNLAMQFRPWGRIWLAGGLTPENVADAIAKVRPHAVDVSSGVEVSPGVKAPELIRGFIDSVHHADHAIAKEQKSAH